MKIFDSLLHFAVCVAFVLPLSVHAQQVSTLPSPLSVGTSQQPQVARYTLPNGMGLWVKSDRRAPTVTHMVWYRVGARDEVDGVSGVAHMLEHMMFRGTQKIAGGAFSRRVAELGGYDNAFTGSDMTAYYQQIPVQALFEVMQMDADRMTNLTLNNEDFLKELEVVKEERRMRTDEQPRSQLWERMQAAVYMADPYHRPVVGWMSDLDAMTINDVRMFYERWYRPDNSAVIIVGDISPQEAYNFALQTYGTIPAPSTVLEPSKPRTEPVQRGVRRIEHKAPAAQSYVMLAFKVPGLKDWEGNDADSQDVYALTLLAAVLDGTSSSRLSRALVQGEEGQRIADSVGVSYGISARGPVLFLLAGVPSKEHTPEELEQAIRFEIARIAQDGVDAKELQRIKTQWVASQVYQNDSQMAQAQDLGSNWILGAPPLATQMMLEHLREVTPEQVQQVAAKYFEEDQLTVGILRAQPLPQTNDNIQENTSAVLVHE